MSVRVRVKFCGDLHYSEGFVSRAFDDGRVEVTFDRRFNHGHVQDFEPDQVEFESVIDSLASLA